MPKLKFTWDETTTFSKEMEIPDYEVDRFRGKMDVRELIAAVKDSLVPQSITPPKTVNYESALLSFEIEMADGTKVYMSDRR